MKTGSIFRFSLLILSIFAGFGCKKADPHPELKDPLYILNQNEADAAQKAIAEAETAIVDAEAQMKKAIPQTGQIKFATKRYWEARNRLVMAKQRLQFLQTRAELQKWRTREGSLEAFYQDRIYNNKSELESYQTQQELGQLSRNWDVKKRRAKLGLPTGREPASGPALSGGGGGHGEAKGHGAAESESGGHH